jgi:outer membrane murein-binding lipoprotein Lpp
LIVRGHKAMKKLTLLTLLIAACMLTGCSSQTDSTETGGAPAGASIEELAERVDGERKSAEAAAKELLKNPVEAPFPPSISLKCHHDTEAQDDAIINKFIEEFNKPELEVLNALLSASGNKELLTGNLSDPKFNLELRVLNKNGQKKFQKSI